MLTHNLIFFTILILKVRIYTSAAVLPDSGFFDPSVNTCNTEYYSWNIYRWTNYSVGMFISVLCIALHICKSIIGIGNIQEGIAGIARKRAISWSFNPFLLAFFLPTKACTFFVLIFPTIFQKDSNWMAFQMTLYTRPVPHILSFSSGNSLISTCNDTTGEDLNAP